MWSGVFYAWLAGMMWGIVFIGPLLLPEYPATLLSVGRYLAFGLIVLIPAWFSRTELRKLNQTDWLCAFKLTLIGNLLYYIFLASAIQYTGGPLAIVILGTLPVVITISANLREKKQIDRIPRKQLFVSLLLLAFGIACVNHIEIKTLYYSSPIKTENYRNGAILAVMAVICWAWYALKNAEWLRMHIKYSPKNWATAQGLVTLPLAFVGWLFLWGRAELSLSQFSMPFGPRPVFFISLMLIIGLCASWLGTFYWNVASQKLKTAWVGQLIVFEILAALTYTFLLRQEIPNGLACLGIISLVLGVICSFKKD